MNLYKNLTKSKYSDEQLREFADLLVEGATLQNRLEMLEKIHKQNKDMEKYVHVTRDLKPMLLSEMSETHLMNCIAHFEATERDAKKFRMELERRAINNNKPMLEATLEEPDFLGDEENGYSYGG